MQDLAVHYGSIERIWMTLKLLEERGVNTFNLKANNFKRFELHRYRFEYGACSSRCLHRMATFSSGV